MTYTLQELKNITDVLSVLNEDDFVYVPEGYERNNR